MALNAQDNSAQAAARQALEQKIKDLDANPPAATPPPASVSAVPVRTAAVATPVVVAAQKKDTKKKAAKNEAKKQVRAVETIKSTMTAQTPTITAPVVDSFTRSKQDKLNQLLTQYKADLITPQQYHQQRAALLAKP
jgi:hypothetical protein